MKKLINYVLIASFIFVSYFSTSSYAIENGKLTSEDLIKIRKISRDVIGTKYRHESTIPENGFDCDALLHYIYKEGVNIELPLGTDVLANYLDEVSVKDIKPGDIVGYDAKDDGIDKITHMGLYLGRINTETGQYASNGTEYVIHSAPDARNSDLANTSLSDEGVGYITKTRFFSHAGKKLKVYRPYGKNKIKTGDYQVKRSYRLYLDNSYEYNSYENIPDGVKTGEIIKNAVDDGTASIRFTYKGPIKKYYGKMVYLRKVAVEPIREYTTVSDLTTYVKNNSYNAVIPNLYIKNTSNVYDKNLRLISKINKAEVIKGVEVELKGKKYIRFYNEDESKDRYILASDVTANKVSIKVALKKDYQNLRRLSDNSIVRHSYPNEEFTGYIDFDPNAFYGKMFVTNIIYNGKIENVKLSLNAIDLPNISGDEFITEKDETPKSPIPNGKELKKFTVGESVYFRNAKNNAIIGTLYSDISVQGYLEGDYVYFVNNNTLVKAHYSFFKIFEKQEDLYVDSPVNVRNKDREIVGVAEKGTHIKGVKIGNYYRYYDNGEKYIHYSYLQNKPIEIGVYMNKGAYLINASNNSRYTYEKIGKYLEGIFKDDYFYATYRGVKVKVNKNDVSNLRGQFRTITDDVYVRNQDFNIVGTKYRGEKFYTVRIGEYYRFYDNGEKFIHYSFAE